MTAPVRLQLSRARGFNLQEHSRAVNGLPAVNCARPGKWGNPAFVGAYFKIGDPDPRRAGPFQMAFCITTAKYATPLFTFVENKEIAAKLFADLMATGFWEGRLYLLNGKNLACFCKLGDPCHADVLLELANR